MLQKPRARAECYNDLDARIVGFFRVLRDPTKAAELQRRVALTPYARDEHAWSMDPADASDDVDAAHRLVVRSFMGHGSDSATRTSRTGFRARLTDGRALPSAEWSTWADSIPAFRDRLAGVMLENDNAISVIGRMDSPTTLIYADPPYVHSSRSAMTGRSSTTNGYLFEMTDFDHRMLADRLHRCSSMVVLSGYPSELYDELYGDWTQHEKQHVADRAAIRTEMLWLNPAAAHNLQEKT